MPDSNCLRLVDDAPKSKPRLLDSDAVLQRYQAQYDDMPRKYAILTQSRVGLIRRALRWIRAKAARVEWWKLRVDKSRVL